MVKMTASAHAHAAEPPAVRPPLLFLAIAAAGLATPLYTAWLTLSTSDINGVHIALLHWISVPYVLVGLVAWARRPESRFGALMVGVGFTMGLSTLQFAHEDILFTLGAAFDLVPAALFLHVYLAFPDGRLRSQLERALVAGAYATTIGLQIVKMSLGTFGPQNVLAITAESGGAEVVQQIQLVLLSAILLGGVGALGLRRRHDGRLRRRSLALLIDTFALGLVMAALLFVVGAFGTFGAVFEPIQRATLLVIGISPFAFLIGLLDARLARSAVGGLIIELRADLAPADLQDALARALRDPSLTLAYWLPGFHSYGDLDGRPVEVPGQDGRATTLIDREGVRIAALLHDTALDDERHLLDAVTAAAGIALENARLHAELRARLEELQASRARVIDAGQKERQRLERNLHDGAQQRLIALSLELGLLEQRLAANPGAQGRVDDARRQIALSLSELRDVARGIHPAVVSGHGLKVALESIVAHASLPVRLRVELEGRQEEPLEVAAYYVVSESLANIAKHARATSATVDVARKGRQIVVEIVDNGVGGADTERGTGLRGLADRVEALGGRLRVWTPTGGGTRVKAELPCA
jgi:signal transduction histidine kinase